MNNNLKNESNNKNNSINNNPNINIENDLNDLIKYGRWELTLISSLKSEKIYKKNLLLIDKEWLLNWKIITGYNLIKREIFNYLINTQKKGKDKLSIEEENKKINTKWLNVKSKNNIDISNINNIPALDNKKYLLHINNKTLINGRDDFDIISNDIFDLFKKYLEKTSSIKVGGLFYKKKLLLPFNYNDKNIDYIFINMIFIKNNKNELGEILFEFPKLKLNIIEKIRKEISNKNIDEYIKEINEQSYNIKEFVFADEDGMKYTYKALYKNNIKKINSKNEINIINNETNNLNIIDLKDILDFDINNLTKEQIEKKIKEIEEKTLKQIEIENDLKEKENLLLKSNGINLIQDEYDKYDIKIREIKSKINKKELENYQEKENKLNEEYNKAKINSINKENQINKNLNELHEIENLINAKLENITKRENAIKMREKDLNIREQKINLEKRNNKEKLNDIKNLEEEIEQKERLLKKQEDLENERITKELEDEMKELENQVKLKDKNKNNMDSIDEEKEGNNSVDSINDDKIKDNKQSLNNLSNNKTNKYKKLNMQQVKNPFLKQNTLNIKNNISPKLEQYKSNTISNNDNNILNKDRMSLPNLNYKNKLFTLKNSDEIQDKIIIDKNIISLGLQQMNPVNLNSIIQCFVQLKEISEGLLNLEKQNFFNNNKECILSKGYLDIIKNLFFPENDNIYSLNDFLNLLQTKDKKNIFMKNKLYIEPKNIINFLIEELHKELNTKKRMSKQLNTIKNKFESENEKEALCKYLEDFTINNNSLISKNFYGLLKNKIICQGCKKGKYIFEFYTFLTFNLSQVKNFISKEKNQNKKDNKTILKLSDCFDYLNKPEYLVGDSGLYCKNCKSKNNTTLLKSIYSSHPIIPIILDRDDDKKLNKDKIDFPEELDLSKYIEYKSSSKQFYLCGVVTNFGYSNNFGKFEAFCRMEKDGIWYNFSDEKVTKNNWEDIHKNGIQYVLFYHKI